jgi:transcriptional regulator with XRE-family HTH domain
MSTPLTDNTSHNGYGPCGKHFVVDKGRTRESLADFVSRVRHREGYSLNKVSQRSGGRIGKTHINRIENGYTTNPSPLKLRALAQGLGVLEEELFAAAGGKSLAEPNTVEKRMLTKFRELPAATQTVVIKIVDGLHRDHVEQAAQVKPAAKGHGRSA